MLFGLDISHHQDLGLDLARCRREGIRFVFIKSTEGSGFTDPEFAANLAEARNAGLLTAAYHYVRANAPAAAQVARIRTAVPLDVPVVLDVEEGSGGVGMVRDLVGRLRAAGYRVPLLYLPRWYWQQLGRPSLAGLPPLWSSRYPDGVVGSIEDEWADVPASYWVGYGGLPVAVLQFTSSARIAGHQPLDANAYPGTAADLAALLGAGHPPQEDDVSTYPDIAEQNNCYAAMNNLLVDAAAGSNSAAAAALRQILGADAIAAALTELSDDEAHILAAIRNIPTGDVDEGALAMALGPVLAPLIQSGATPEQVEAAVRQVFASAAGE